MESTWKVETRKDKSDIENVITPLTPTPRTLGPMKITSKYLHYNMLATMPENLKCMYVNIHIQSVS